ncbi:MAG: ABC transporter permease [Actinomycetota bacterium]
MRRSFSIALAGLRMAMRERSTLFFTVAFPFLIIFVIGNATAGFSDDAVVVGVVDASDDELSADLVRAIDASPLVNVTRAESADELRSLLRRGAFVAGVVIDEGYEDALRDGREANVRFLNDLSRGFPGPVRAVISSAVGEQGELMQAASFAASKADISFDQALVEARKTKGIIPTIGVATQEVGAKPQTRFLMSGFEYTAPSNFVLFVFITSLASSALLINSRQIGVVRRMLATPTPVRELVGGFLLNYFFLALAQGLVIVLLGIAVFGVDFGDPLGAIALASLFVLVGTTFGVLAGTIFRTPEQASSIAPPIGIAMGMLSGCMWPRFVMPEVMQRIGQLFPHSWAMDGFIELIAREGTFVDILPQLAILAAFVVVLLPVAAWRLRRAVVAA